MLDKIKNKIFDLLDVWFSYSGKIGRVTYSVSILLLLVLYFIVVSYIKEYVYLLLLSVCGLNVFFIIMQKRCYDIGWEPKKYLILFSLAIVALSSYPYFVGTKFVMLYFIVASLPVFGALLANFILMLHSGKGVNGSDLDGNLIDNIARVIIVAVTFVGVLVSLSK